MKRFKVAGLSLVFLGLIVALISGCAVGPHAYVAPPTPTITINTIPSGADISIKGNYMGISPLTIPAPANYTGSEPIKIEARIEGYESREVLFGDYHPPQDEVLEKKVETLLDTRYIPVGVKTIPAYYTYDNRIDIKLYAKSGSASVPNVSSDVQKSAPATRIPAGVYQATRNYSNGDTYIGEFLQGQFHGKGIYTYANGDKYEGEFINGKFTGKGSFTCSNGKQFVGNLENKVPLEFTIRCQ